MLMSEGEACARLAGPVRFGALTADGADFVAFELALAAC